jgi:hypothetical protein
MHTSTAQDLVLKTPELVEHIFLQLPLFDLLVNAQSVSKHWNNLIQESPTLQQHLFFRVTPQTSCQEQAFNPLLKTSFGPFFDNHDEKSIRWSTGIPFDELARINTDDKRKAFLRKEATWRRMLPAQPPIRQLNIALRTHAMGGDSESSGKAVFEDGVRMGNMYDLALDQARVRITNVGFNWTTEESTGLLGSLAESVGLGCDQFALAMVVHHTIQCSRGGREPLAAFRSEGYEEVKIEWGTEKYVPRSR